MFKIYRQVLDQIGQQLEQSDLVNEQNIREGLKYTLEQRIAEPVDVDGAAIFTLDKSGQLRTANGRAVRLLQSEVGQRVDADFCTPTLSQLFAQNGGAPRLAQWVRGAADLVLFVVQTNADDQSLHFKEIVPSFAPILHKPFEEIFDLTPAEMSVLARLVKGQDAEIIAAKTQRKLSTVRQYIKSILQKTNCSSKDQLVGITAFASASFDHTQLRQENHAHQMQLNRVASEGQIIPYRRFGMKGGVPIILFHGAFFGIAPHNSTRIAAHNIGVDIVALERPGYGENSIADGADLVQTAVWQTRALMKHFGWQKAILLGHDIGTHFAFAFARAEPQLVAGIVCGATTPPMRDLSHTTHMPRLHRVNAWAAQKMPEMMQWIVNVGISQIEKKGFAIIPNLLFADAHFDRDYLQDPQHLAALEQTFELVKAQKAFGFTDDMRVTNLNWWAWLREIECPVHLFHGAQSQTVAQGAVEEMAAQLKRGRLTIIQRAGHALPFSHAADLMRAANTIFLTAQNQPHGL